MSNLFELSLIERLTAPQNPFCHWVWPHALSADEQRAGCGTNIREHNETTMCPQRSKYKTCSEDLAILWSQMCLLFTAFNLRAGAVSRLTARQDEWQAQWSEPSDGGSGVGGCRWATLCWLLLKKGCTQLIKTLCDTAVDKQQFDYEMSITILELQKDQRIPTTTNWTQKVEAPVLPSYFIC